MKQHARKPFSILSLVALTLAAFGYATAQNFENDLRDAYPEISLEELLGSYETGMQQIEVVRGREENLPPQQAGPYDDFGAELEPEVLDFSGALTYNEEIARLQQLAVSNVDVNEASLRDVVRLLADASRMSYLGLPPDPVLDTSVSLTISQNPFAVLKLLSESYDFEMNYENGIWSFNPVDQAELLARTYLIKYNTRESVAVQGGGDEGLGGGDTDDGGGGNTGATAEFTDLSREDSVIAETINSFLQLSNRATIQPGDITVDMVANSMGRPATKSRVGLGTDGAAAQPTGGSVSWDSDNNTLFVIATRQQHRWIEGYLRSVDRPQPLILIEARLYSAQENPEFALGVNWAATLATGYDLSIEGLGDVAADVSNRSLSWDKTFRISGGDIGASLNAWAQDNNLKAVQYPQTVTLNNRLVRLESVIEVPTRSGSTSISSGSAESTETIEYIPIGTIVQILPKVIDQSFILLDIALEVSDSSREVVINNDPFPVRESRKYFNKVKIRSGYTLAMGGLQQSSNSQTSNKIPLLGDLPIIGNAFSYESETVTRNNLILMITPTILPDFQGGSNTEPQNILPSEGPIRPRRIFVGSPTESMGDIRESFRGFDREVAELGQIVEEGRGDWDVEAMADGMITELDLMLVRLGELGVEGHRAPTLERDIRKAIQHIEIIKEEY